MQHLLHEYLVEAAKRGPSRIALEAGPDDQCTYRQLEERSRFICSWLYTSGVRQGDRVGLLMPKSIDTIATIFGILRLGAAYIPLDIESPFDRILAIVEDCQMAAIVSDELTYNSFGETRKLTPGMVLYLPQVCAGDVPDAQASGLSERITEDAIAYILYTSGSTGMPKGVVHSHKNAIAFIEWCGETFSPDRNDRFASHAPFYFDLSILDIFVPLKQGATLVLINSVTGRDPRALARFIAEQKITFWYSTPSVLALLIQYGKMDCYTYSLKTILFAGEVFAIRYLRKLRKKFETARIFNLYGPTETNVCTFFEIPGEIPEDREQGYPIGKPCSQFRSIVVDENNQPMPLRHTGELCISGIGVMVEYWQRAEETNAAFFVDDSGRQWYKTGDLVFECEDGNYHFIGRRDRMIKRRGFRIELGEIEACLLRHPDIVEAAAISFSKTTEEKRIEVFFSCSNRPFPTQMALREFCSRHIPTYMIADHFTFLEVLPKTKTDKIDYYKLKELV